MRRLLERFSLWLLHLAESFYLRAHGWRKDGKDRWFTPKNYPRPRDYSLSGGHAVNSQKYWYYNPPRLPRRRG